MIRKMVKAGCLSEQETKYITNSDPQVPGLDLYDGGPGYPLQTENILGTALFDVTPNIPQLGGGAQAGPGVRIGNDITMTRFISRFQLTPYNEEGDTTNAHLFDPARCEIRIHYIRAKKNAAMTSTKVNRALKNLRPGAIPIDSKEDVDKEFRKQFTILETVKLMPKYYRSETSVVYPAVLGTENFDNSNPQPLTTGHSVPVTVSWAGGIPTYNRIDGHLDANNGVITYVGRESAFTISHNFHGKNMIFDGTAPRDYNYFLAFQIGDWTYAYRSADERLEKFPKVKIWNSYLFKDA